MFQCMTTDRWSSEGLGLELAPVVKETLAIHNSLAHETNVQKGANLLLKYGEMMSQQKLNIVIN